MKLTHNSTTQHLHSQVIVKNKQRYMNSGRSSHHKDGQSVQHNYSSSIRLPVKEFQNTADSLSETNRKNKFDLLQHDKPSTPLHSQSIKLVLSGP